MCCDLDDGALWLLLANEDYMVPCHPALWQIRDGRCALVLGGLASLGFDDAFTRVICRSSFFYFDPCGACPRTFTKPSGVFGRAHASPDNRGFVAFGLPIPTEESSTLREGSCCRPVARRGA